MSAHKVPIRFAAEARQDIRDILIFTAKRWGTQKRAVYRDELDAAFATIRANPSIDRSRDDLMDGVRGLVVRQHTILYTVEDDVIIVLRVVHVRMDVDATLNP